MASRETPSNTLWVGNLSPGVIDADLVSLFQDFGPIDSITRDTFRRSRYINFRYINNSKEAKDALQGFFFHGNPLRIEFAKPEQVPEFRENLNRSIVRNYSDPRQQPSRMLCIRFPPSVHVDNEMIRNAMILLGEINRIQTFDDMNFSLVKFRRVEEALRAKEGLQGKLFNDPRITVEYLSDENCRMLASNARISPGHHYSAYDNIWRGIIAKNGTSVCRAVCVPILESIESEIPDVVNFSAGAGLDKLTKHFAEAAVGFSIGFFMPDTDKDSSSYAEFLRYLSSRDRVGVAKLCDETNMYLVPPSDFLSKVLKVDGPPCLYAVVLKYAPSGAPESYQPRAPGSLTAAYPTNTMQPSNSAAYPSNPVHQSNTAAPAQAGVSLTPELIPTLAKMLPANQLPSVEGATMPAGASAGMSASDVAVAPSKVQQESWRYEHQAPGHAADHMFGSQFNNQTQVLSQLQAHPQVLNTPNHYSQGATSFSQMQDHNLNHQAQGGPPQTLPSTIISQGTQLSAQPHVDRQLQLGRHQDAASGSGIAHGTDALGHYGSSVPQQQTNLASLTNQTHGAHVSQSQAGMPVASGMGLGTQMQQLQSALYGSVLEGSESEVDKNERYQATLLFAASLLSKIHNQKPGSQSGQGSDNH